MSRQEPLPPPGGNFVSCGLPPAGMSRGGGDRRRRSGVMSAGVMGAGIVVATATNGVPATAPAAARGCAAAAAEATTTAAADGAAGTTGVGGVGAGVGAEGVVIRPTATAFVAAASGVVTCGGIPDSCCTGATDTSADAGPPLPTLLRLVTKLIRETSSAARLPPRAVAPQVCCL